MGAVSELSREREDWRFQQPKFHTSKIITSITVQSGEWQLLNASVLREPEPAIEFFLMRVTTFSTQP